MEKNGLEAAQIVAHSLWLHLPTEMWFQVFGWLRATQYIALIGALSKGFREFMLDYFKATSQWMNKNMNVAVIGAPAVGKTTMLAQLLIQLRLNNIEHRFANYIKARPQLPVVSHYNTFLNAPNSAKPMEYTQHVKQFYFATSLHNFTFFDTPGCQRRLITAYRICTQANTAILMLQRKIELDLDWLTSGMTASWTSLTHSNIIIAINYYRTYFTQKNWEADQKLVYEKIVKAVPPKLVANIKLIPINAFEGFNIYSPHAGIDDTNSWYNGPTLYRALHAIWEKLEYPEDRVGMPFSMTILRPVRIGGVGPVITGTVNSGCLKPNMELRICCASYSSTLVVNNIQQKRANINQALPSDHIGISFKAASLTSLYKTDWNLLKQAKFGMIIADAKNPPQRVKSFMAAIAITSSRVAKMTEGRQYKAIYQGNHIFVVFKTFIQVVDKDRKERVRQGAFATMRPGDSCLALCVPTQEMWTYPKSTKKNQKKDSRDVILFTLQRRIAAVGRIDSITFFEPNEVNNQPKQFAHMSQPELK